MDDSDDGWFFSEPFTANDGVEGSLYENLSLPPTATTVASPLAKDNKRKYPTSFGSPSNFHFHKTWGNNTYSQPVDVSYGRDPRKGGDSRPIYLAPERHELETTSSGALLTLDDSSQTKTTPPSQPQNTSRTGGPLPAPEGYCSESPAKVPPPVSMSDDEKNKPTLLSQPDDIPWTEPDSPRWELSVTPDLGLASIPRPASLDALEHLMKSRDTEKDRLKRQDFYPGLEPELIDLDLSYLGPTQQMGEEETQEEGSATMLHHTEAQANLEKESPEMQQLFSEIKDEAPYVLSSCLKKSKKRRRGQRKDKRPVSQPVKECLPLSSINGTNDDQPHAVEQGADNNRYTSTSLPCVGPANTHRERLVGWEADHRRAGVKGRLLEVLHGYADNSPRQPRTLVVFEWRLVPGTYGERLKHVQILVAFQGEQVKYDPVPLVWAPDAPIYSHFSRMLVTKTRGGEIGAQVGYMPFAAGTAKVKHDTTRTVERIDSRSIFGTAVTYKPKGTPQNADRDVNAVLWNLEENVSLQSGLQYCIRTAVLLKRRPHHKKPFTLTVQAEANVTRARELMQTVLRMIKVSRGETKGRTAFDPTVKPGTGADGVYDDNVAARPTKRDWRNLQTVDLKEILLDDCEPSTVPSTTGGDESARNAESEDTSVADTNATQQMPEISLSISAD